MKRIAWFLITFATIAALAACNNTNTTNNSKNETVPFKATLTIPKTAKIGDKIELKVNITQGGQTVTNAKDVAFEIENTTTDSDKIVTAKLRDDAYVASYDIKNSGNYKITAHISAKDGGHAMSNAEITVSQKASQDNHNSTTGSVTEKVSVELSTHINKNEPMR